MNKLTVAALGISMFLLSQGPWLLGQVGGPLEVVPGGRFLQHGDGKAFLWLGCTVWGMTEMLSREEVDLYLDDRASKGMNVVQICLFWGKRTKDPVSFSVNPENRYGHRAFEELDGKLDTGKPAVRDGGTALSPNDYWDHVEYCFAAAAERGMYVAALPIWGRRYVNASHEGYSEEVFSEGNAWTYGKFLATRFETSSNVIWVMGGDVDPLENGDHRAVYKGLAEGLQSGRKSDAVRLMSYHPNGVPLRNSSSFFHDEAWLDFNMIETFQLRHLVAAAVRADIELLPRKPTILAEGAYEGFLDSEETSAVAVRQQAYHAFFCGAAGFTYGGSFGAKGEGPLFAPGDGWRELLELEGAGQLRYLRTLLERFDCPDWRTLPEAIRTGRGEGWREKVAVKSGDWTLVYFPEATRCELGLERSEEAFWFDPRTGKWVAGAVNDIGSFIPPDGFEDAVLLVK